MTQQVNTCKNRRHTWSKCRSLWASQRAWSSSRSWPSCASWWSCAWIGWEKLRSWRWGIPLWNVSLQVWRVVDEMICFCVLRKGGRCGPIYRFFQFLDLQDTVLFSRSTTHASASAVALMSQIMGLDKENGTAVAQTSHITSDWLRFRWR